MLGLKNPLFIVITYYLINVCIKTNFTLFYSGGTLPRLSIPIFTECGEIEQNDNDNDNPGNFLRKYISQIVCFVFLTLVVSHKAQKVLLW
jgi:hypothetical protein